MNLAIVLSHGRLPFAFAVLGALVGCSQGQNSVIGPSEPFRMRGNSVQFIRGNLPGTVPTPGETPEASDLPSIAAVDLNSLIVTQGGSKSISGRASANATSIGIAMEGVGAGYWVVPTRSQDPITGELTWGVASANQSGLVADFDLGIESGVRPLHLVAFDETGRAGIQFIQKLCVRSAVPDNLNSCEPSVTPPEAVFSLSWDVNADLDLQVLTPDGLLVTPKRGSTIDPDADAGSAPGPLGTIDHDSNANCVSDGVRRESLVFQTESPSPGYLFFANLHDACKQPVVRFNMQVWSATTDEDGGKRLELKFQRGGELLDSQVNPGSGRGLFVGAY
ncbi:MAG TPA: hypothetical protein VFQ35_27670 [Polyangiaceae bacterium]|nr:hypothetical protein [Polyangiaceae bacterium]